MNDPNATIWIPPEDENLRDLNDWAEKDWYALLAAQKRFRTKWRMAEWQSYGFLLDAALNRVLARLPGVDGIRRVRVLELGFGVGRGIDQLTNQFAVPQSFITGVEVLEYRVEGARKTWPGARFELMGPKIGDLLDWMEAERATMKGYSLILARHVLQRLPFPDRVMRGIAGLLVEGGVLAMMVPRPGTNQVDGPTTFSDLKVWFEDPGVSQVKVGRMGPVELAGHQFVTEQRRFRKGWLPILTEAKLDPVDMGRHPHRALPGGEEFYVLARRTA